MAQMAMESGTMGRTVARRLARQIRKVPGVEVTGTRLYDHRHVAIDVVDTVTGVPFVVHCPADWAERVRAAEAPGIDGLTS